ncbi:MAG: glycosyltransferase [Candidatus Micrarchaeota archaeon]|nr:glycosyltransferase [Candidatus Micrarchaeota archaeon]
MPRNPAVSVIIPSYNEEKYISHSLEGLEDQTFKNFETIVVDKDSTDATQEIARSYGAKVVSEPRKGIGLARNTGSKVAKGDLLVFLDADTRPHPELLGVYSKAFDDDSVTAATGPILPIENSSRRIRWGFKFVSVFFVKSSILIGRPSVVGLNFAVTKDAFRKVGGFDEKLATYEDWDLSLRLRKVGKIKYLDDALVHTSARRVQAWGIYGFFRYHTGNMFRYHLLGKPKENYDPIR